MPGEYVRLTDFYSAKQMAYLSNLQGTKKQIRRKIAWHLICNPRCLWKIKRFYNKGWRDALHWGIYHWSSLLSQRNEKDMEPDTNVF